MHFRHIAAGGLGALRIGLCSLAVAQLSFGATVTSAAANRSLDTRTPIKHVIVIIGENRSFDHVFATYVPKKGESVNNLLSEGIVALDADKNATPGPNFKKAHQLAASDQGGADTFLLSPPMEPAADSSGIQISAGSAGRYPHRPDPTRRAGALF
jgi:phospholipase C